MRYITANFIVTVYIKYMAITSFQLKITAVTLLLIPLVLLFMLAIGELVGGELPGLEHILQALPLVLLTYVAWRFPNKGGKFIFSIAVLLGILYVFYPPIGFPLEFRLINSFILFGPAALAGIIFITASQKGINHG